MPTRNLMERRVRDGISCGTAGTHRAHAVVLAKDSWVKPRRMGTAERTACQSRDVSAAVVHPTDSTLFIR